MYIKNKRNMSHTEILDAILRDSCRKCKTYIILGKPGPTGKTWLWDRLRNIEGLNAIELSETILPYISYKDDENHMITDIFDNTVLIILNKPLDLKKIRGKNNMSKNITIEEMNKHYNMLLYEINKCTNEESLYGVADAVDEYAIGNGITSSQYKDLLERIEDKEVDMLCEK